MTVLLDQHQTESFGGSGNVGVPPFATGGNEESDEREGASYPGDSAEDEYFNVYTQYSLPYWIFFFFTLLIISLLTIVSLVFVTSLVFASKSIL